MTNVNSLSIQKEQMNCLKKLLFMFFKNNNVFQAINEAMNLEQETLNVFEIINDKGMSYSFLKINLRYWNKKCIELDFSLALEDIRIDTFNGEKWELEHFNFSQSEQLENYIRSQFSK